MDWIVEIENKHGQIITESLCSSWWSAHRLVMGITGYKDTQVADPSTEYEKEFSVQWYKEFIYVKRNNKFVLVRTTT